jgi:penicillin-binding protein 1C
MKWRVGHWILAAAALKAALTIVTLAVLLWPSSDVPEFAGVRAKWRPSEAYLLDRNGELLDSVRVDFGVRRDEWVRIAEISPALIDAVVDGEDQRFWRHSGVDWLGGLAALKDQLLEDRGRGASTITMQLAGMIDARVRDHGPRGSWRRKLAQIRVARGIESQWDKEQILEAYFNLLEFRGELQGIGAAARVLADKAPSGLNLSESLLMAALLPAPGATVEKVVARACARAKARELSVSCESIRISANDVLSRAAHAAEPDRLAPHLARALLKRPGERVQTTLDARLQRQARDALNRHLSNLASRNVRDGAALVVDNATGDVLAYVGSAGPNSRAREVDGVRARRQAGSTLKPYLYELALERRLLTAASLLDDSPLHLDTASGIYLPQDYDRDFKGLVSVRTALASSLNIPAVRTLVLVGVEPFRDRLYELGYAGIIRDGEYYGYSLALGSAEVSLWEQAQAYRALARAGSWSPIRLAAGGPVTERRVLPAAAAFVTADILSDRAARSLTFGLDNHLNTPYWSAVKTGTSKDMRDNWCIGFSQRFTVAVWVGNFEGDAMHDVSGVTGAAPAWQEIMAALHADLTPAAPATPPGVSASLTEFSPAFEPPRREWFLANTSSPKVVAVSALDEIARISSPANGMVIAVDPDIPVQFQRLPLLAKGAGPSAQFRLNGTIIGTATKGVLWEPQAGAHRLILEDAGGTVLDQILFTVR